METVVTHQPTVNGHAETRAAEVPLTQRQASVIARIIATLALGTERAARWFVLVFACALFAVTMWQPDRLVIPVVFSLLIVTPMWWRTMFPRKEPRDG